MKRLVVGFTGEIASGKGTGTELVKEWFPGTASCRFSDSLREFYSGFVLPEVVPLARPPLRAGEHYRRNVAPFVMYGKLFDALSRTFVPECGRDAVMVRAFADWLTRRFLPSLPDPALKEAGRRELQSISEHLRRIFGEDLLERTVMRRLASSGVEHPIVILEGIRRLVDIGAIKRSDEVRFRLVYVDAREDVRFRRMKKRAENPGEAEMTLEEFRRRCLAEPEREIRMLKVHADAVITNNRSRAEFAKKLRKQIGRWGMEC